MSTYDTKKVLDGKKSKLITYDDILSKTDEYSIFEHYLGSFRIGRAYNSPLRKDNTPSFAIFPDKKTGSLLYKDMSTGDCGDAVKFVKTLFNLKNYKEALLRIEEDMNLQVKKENLTRIFYRRKPAKISIKRRSMSNSDLEYWKSYGIKKSTLDKFKVFSISAHATNEESFTKYKRDELVFAYKVFDKFKIYRPLSTNKSDKWRGNLGVLDIMGFEQLPETGKCLIITKSLKDVMLLYELGICAISPASETTVIPKAVINNIKSRFSKIIMLYDRDRAGVLYTRKNVKEHGLDFMFIKDKKSKDISDFARNEGIEKAKELILGMIGARTKRGE